VQEAYLLGILCSIPFDWYARRFIETAVNFHLLNAWPIAGAQRAVLVHRIVELSGTLAAVDNRYENWAESIGVPVGALLEEKEREAAVCELDALVSLSYGLERDQVEHIFETFHRGWDYGPRLAKVLEFYDSWKEKE
jgi:hypothetical protein